MSIPEERYHEIMCLVDEYNTERAPGHILPFFARAAGRLDVVADKIGVPTDELAEFLDRVEQEDLPPVD